MKSADEIFKMSHEEAIAYRDELVEAEIQKANPRNVLKLRKIHADMRVIDRIKNQDVRRIKSNEAMMRSFLEMNEALKGFRNE